MSRKRGKTGDRDASAGDALSERLKLFLEIRGLSAGEFAAETGVPDRTLRNYLGRKSRPGADQLARMAAAGLDVNWLLTGSLRGGLGALFLTPPTEREGVVAADAHLHGLALQEAFAAADGYIKRRRAGGGTPLTAYQTYLVVAWYLQLIVTWAAKSIDLIKKCQGSVSSPELLREILVMPLTSDLYDRVDSVVSSHAEDSPP